MMKRLLVSALFAVLLTTQAAAQSACASITTGAVLTVAQWNACFAAKENVLGFTPLNRAGGVMTGPLITFGSTTASTGFRLPVGSAPTSPTNGDLWVTSSGLFTRIGGVTIGPVGGATSSSFSATSPMVVTFPAGVVNYAFDFSVANTFTATQTLRTILAGTTNTYDIGTSAAAAAFRTIYAGTSFVGPAGTFTTSVAAGGCTIGSNALCATGTANISGAMTLGGALTYGGVALSNSVTGTGSMVLSAAPTITGNVTVQGVTSTGATGTGAFVFGTAPSMTSATIAAGTLSGTFAGTPTFSGANFVTLGNVAQIAAYSLLGNTTGSTANIAAFTIAGLTAKEPPVGGDYLLLSDQSASGALKRVLVSSVSGLGAVTSFNGEIGSIVLDVTPGGRLTLVSPNGCALNTDQVAMTVIYYAPCGHAWIPIYDGTNMPMKKFTSSVTDATGLSVTLGASWGATTLYDWFVGVNSGTVTLCSGPAWSNSAAGTSARGTGAGTTQLAMLNGLWANAVSMTCRYANASTFTCGINQCTYVGTTLTASAGQINLKFGLAATGGNQYGLLSICNMYNRQDVRVSSSDTTSSWSDSGGVWRGANSNLTGTQIVSCMGDVGLNATYQDSVQSAGGALYAGIGLNSTTVLATRSSTAFAQGAAGTFVGLTATLREIMPLGLNNVSALEYASSAAQTFYGGTAMAFTADAKM